MIWKDTNFTPTFLLDFSPQRRKKLSTLFPIMRRTRLKERIMQGKNISYYGRNVIPKTVGLPGLEPGTYGLATRCYFQFSFRPKGKKFRRLGDLTITEPLFFKNHCGSFCSVTATNSLSVQYPRDTFLNRLSRLRYDWTVL